MANDKDRLRLTGTDGNIIACDAAPLLRFADAIQFRRRANDQTAARWPQWTSTYLGPGSPRSTACHGDCFGRRPVIRPAIQRSRPPPIRWDRENEASWARPGT